MAKKPLILLTNDDGITSPGLLAAVKAAVTLGDVLIVAPKTQQTGAGRSFVKLTDRQIYQHALSLDQEILSAYSINGTPAQAVRVALLDLAPRPVDLVISGINFGENIGTGITVSGTVGAALEAASANIPALAVSLKLPIEYHYDFSDDIDFETATYFTGLFARKALNLSSFPTDVDLLKIDIPTRATSQTEWRVTCVSRQSYHYGLTSPPERRGQMVEPGYVTRIDEAALEPNSDIQAVCLDQVVSVTPISLDLTSRIALETLMQTLK